MKQLEQSKHNEYLQKLKELDEAKPRDANQILLDLDKELADTIIEAKFKPPVKFVPPPRDEQSLIQTLDEVDQRYQ